MKSKRSQQAALPSKRALKKLPKLSKAAVKMLVRVYEGHFYPWQPEPHGAMRELVDAGLVVSTGRVALLKSCYVPPGTRPAKLEAIPAMPNWLHAVYVAQSFATIHRNVKSSKSDVSAKP